MKVIDGMCRIATHFISSHQLIQSRANAYIRCKLAGAEVLLNGVVVSQSEQSIERDQILLSSVTVPPTPRDVLALSSPVTPTGKPKNSHLNDKIKSGQSILDDAELLEGASSVVGTEDVASGRFSPAPASKSLFRSKSVKQEHLNSFASSVFALDDNTLSATLNFLPESFLDNGFISRNGMSAYDEERLQEMWTFFDFDEDGIVTRDDLLLGVTNIAKNFIANDQFTQLLTNSYIQRKIRRAICAIDTHQQHRVATNDNSMCVGISNDNAVMAMDTNAGHSGFQFQPHTGALYTDEEGNLHIAQIVRISNRKVRGVDAYYIEIKGMRLYVSAQRLCPITDEEQAQVALVQNQQHGVQPLGRGNSALDTHEDTATIASLNEYQLVSQLSRSRLQVDPVIARQASSELIKSMTESSVAHGHDKEKEKGKSAGIFGYLKNLGMGIGRSQNALEAQHQQGDEKVLRNSRSSGVNEGGVSSAARPTDSSSSNIKGKDSNDCNDLASWRSNSSGSRKLNSNKISGGGIATSIEAHVANGVGGEEGAAVSAAAAAAERSGEVRNDLDGSSGSFVAGSSIAPAVAVEAVPAEDDGNGDGGDGPATVEEFEPVLVVVEAVANGEKRKKRLDEKAGSNSGSGSGVDSASVAVVNVDAVSSTTNDIANMTASQRNNMYAALLAADMKVLAKVVAVLGPALRLTRSMIPKPKKVEAYPIYFNR
jgi:hypothetical protein